MTPKPERELLETAPPSIGSGLVTGREWEQELLVRLKVPFLAFPSLLLAFLRLLLASSWPGMLGTSEQSPSHWASSLEPSPAAEAWP